MVVTSGEAAADESDYGVGDDCADLQAQMAVDETSFATLFEAVAPGAEVPTGIDWSSDVAIVSWITWCASGNKQLSVDSIVVTGSDLHAAEVLTVGSWSTGALVRPYNVVTIGARGFATVTTDLTVETSDTKS